MSNEQQKVYPMFQTLRKGNPQKPGTILQIQISRTGDKKGTPIFTMAKQKGVTSSGLPEFDYNEKIFFGLSGIEAAKLLIVTDRLFRDGKLSPTKITFPHLKAHQPKNINFEFSEYNGNPQIALSVILPETKKIYGIYLNMEEMYCICNILKEQISLVHRELYIRG